MRRALFVSVFGVVLLAGCMPETTTSSSGSPGGLVDGSSSEGGASDAPSVDPQRAALCNAYGSRAATCCQQLPGTCTMTSAADWTKHCLTYASSCAGMPTCFSGSDCNTLIYCSGAC